MFIKHFTEGKDLEQSVALRKYVFHSDFTTQKSNDYQHLLGMANKIGAFSEGKLIGQILNLPILINYYGEIIPTAGINHVDVYPENREQGIATQLMLESLKTAKCNHQALAILQPFSPEFYRKFGFDLYTERINYRVNKDKYPEFTRDKSVAIIRKIPEEISKLDIHNIKNVYDTMAKSTNGMQIRNELWWRRHWNQYPNLNYCFALENDKYVGFISYIKSNTTLRIIDFIYNSNKVRKQLWWFLESHKSNIFTIEGISTMNHNLSFDFHDPRIEQDIYLDTMIRIVDVKKFLDIAIKKINISSEIEFSIKDNTANWNSGTYLLSSKGLKFERGIENSQVLTPNQLSTIFLGPLNRRQLIQYLEPTKGTPLNDLINLTTEKEISHFLGEF